MYKLTLSVEGMSCVKCEAHVCNAIRTNFNVKGVIASHVEKRVIVTSKETIEKDALSAVISKLGFTLTDVSCEALEKKGLFSFFKK